MLNNTVSQDSNRLYKINILSFLIIIYVFFNTVALPEGLLYTSILTPFLYIYLLKSGKKYIISKFILVLFPFLFMWLVINDLNLYALLKSISMLMGVYITIYSFIVLFKKQHNANGLFDTVIRVNFYLLIIALIIKYTDISTIMWAKSIITAYTDSISRLKLLTYEPSYYSTILIPFVVFAFVRFLNDLNTRAFFYLIAVLIPLLLSFSMGVLSSLALAVVLSSAVHHNIIFSNKKIVIFVLFLIPIALSILFTENIVSTRISNTIAGVDSSGTNRIYQSTVVAYKIAESSNIWIGAGLGQAKFLAVEFFEPFWPGLGLNRLTNAVADTLATFGIIGVVIRFFMELFLFFYTKVWTSFYRLILFVYIFIYQFTGSYIMNVAEYFIWLLAYVQIFKWEEEWKIK